MKVAGHDIGMLPLILIAGSAVRLILAPLFCDYNDFSFWVGIASDVLNGDGIYRNYDLWYPPVWGYVVGAVSPLLDIFGCAPLETVIDTASASGYRVGDGWIPTPAAVFIIKLPLVFSDIACGYFIYRIAETITKDTKKACCACALWTFCPLTIYVSAVQGQFDTVCALFLVISVWSYLDGSYWICGASIAASVLTKPFTALAVLPILALVWVYGRPTGSSVKYASRYVLGGILMTGILILPQIVSGETQFLTGFLNGRFSTSYPLPADFSMSFVPTANAVAIGDMSPSGQNLSRFFPLSMLISLIVTAYILMKGRMSDTGAVLLISAASCCHLMWYSATGYVQYYVPVIAALSICYACDRRFVYLIAAVTVFALMPALQGFRHAYTLTELGWISVDALESAYSSLHSMFDIPDTIATHLKFLPILLSVILSFRLSRGEEDG